MNETNHKIDKSIGFSIGSVRLSNPVVSAPMAGISDKPFRIIAQAAGCGLVCTEMISSNALYYNSERTRGMIDLSGETGIISVQIFGNDPTIMGQAAQIVTEQGAHIVDINMGCPAPKVVQNQEGSALMNNIPLAKEIIKAVVNATPRPVTVKFRKGWSQDSINVVEMALMAQEQGVAAVTVHGRTRDQFYSGKADWEIIGRVKEHLHIPVIGNGDICSPIDAQNLIAETGCDGVMIGRGGLGNPWLFQRIIHYLETGGILPEPHHTERIATAINHIYLVQKYKSDRCAVKEMRKHIAWYIKGLHGAAKVRDLVNKTETVEELVTVLEELRASY